jgi:hypothetical protein
MLQRDMLPGGVFQPLETRLPACFRGRPALLHRTVSGVENDRFHP